MVTMRSLAGMKPDSMFSKRGLAGAGTARDDDVQPRLDDGTHHLRDC